jgi:SAM-dependent methyltransferase
MTSRSRGDRSQVDDRFQTAIAHPARVYNFWLGGKDNFEADRIAARQVIAAQPGILFGVRANREFLARAVRHLVRDCGIRQFLDIGTGIPTQENTHEVAQFIAEECRVVYVDNDPIVLAHARALLTSSPGGATAYVDADLRDPDTILAEAARTLDFTQPVAILMLLILHLIPDENNPYRIVARLLDSVPEGSYLVISHPASDIQAAASAEAARRYNQFVSTPQTRRTHDQVSRFFTGLHILEPGIVQLHRWRPEPGTAAPPDAISSHGGVGRKPGRAIP